MYSFAVFVKNYLQIILIAHSHNILASGVRENVNYVNYRQWKYTN